MDWGKNYRDKGYLIMCMIIILSYLEITCAQLTRLMAGGSVFQSWLDSSGWWCCLLLSKIAATEELGVKRRHLPVIRPPRTRGPPHIPFRRSTGLAPTRRPNRIHPVHPASSPSARTRPVSPPVGESTPAALVPSTRPIAHVHVSGRASSGCQTPPTPPAIRTVRRIWLRFQKNWLPA